MQIPDPLLLDTSRGDLLPQTRFNATLNAHGLYDGLRFIVRLSPRVHELIASLPNGVRFSSDATFEQMQAFSTYLHETIHWWQHIGSTCGFMMSLSYPAQTHANLLHLRKFLDQVGRVKPIRAWAEMNPGPRDMASPRATANIIINNQFDIAAYRFLATNPERAELLVNNTMFESLAHTYNIALSNGVMALSSTFDRELEFIPDPRSWQKELRKLRQSKEPGYFYGSPIGLSPVGAFHIFEGQARFAQLQYLHFATGGAFDWGDAAAAGMLSPIYMAAFEDFLARTEFARPDTIDHPTVALFMLVCDIAMNPAEAFPFPVLVPKFFIIDVDPGMRFIYLSVIVKHQFPEMRTAITEYSASEYVDVSTKLCRALSTFTPLEIVQEINRWVENGPAFKDCLARHDAGKADALNLPLQVLFGQFASYARDKACYPHILCWPGAHMAGHNVSQDSIGLFSRQSPMFIDRAEDEMIVPIVRTGLDEATVMETFQEFYGGYALYDLTYQWITTPGPFTYNFRWLQPNGTDEQIKAWADRIFTNAYGVSPDDFTSLQA
ncbi:hypothetical protein HNR59_002616 [Aquamicrobium lusatiense]|uniref:Uncharacterized protein n=1 Tax=Aquamicrobium lusatiense TaxID=89772 RepID=A0A7W9S383_9HYPH|nr:hypothetical protein [Aquamicrobium lusatiense]MBB6013271.1 hypothetical protein [Aquamicrobium lusatiense]